MSRHPLGPGFTLHAATPPRRRASWRFYAAMAAAGFLLGGLAVLVLR